MPMQREVFNFEQKGKENFITIRDMDKANERFDHLKSESLSHTELWSSPFPIEDIEDF